MNKTDDNKAAVGGSSPLIWSPLTAGDLYRAAVDGNPIQGNRALATFAEEANWVQIYHGETSPATDYEAKACEWAFVGPSRPPYELAQWALKCLQLSPDASEITRNTEPESTGEPGGRSGVGFESQENIEPSRPADNA